MVSTSNNPLTVKSVSYFQQRFRNRIFEAVLAHFVSQAEEHGLTKKDIADRLGKDPAQITRWLSAPSNWSLDTVSDLLLAMDAETDIQVIPFATRTLPNYAHPVMEYGTGFSKANFAAVSGGKFKALISTTSVKPGGSMRNLDKVATYG